MSVLLNQFHICQRIPKILRPKVEYFLIFSDVSNTGRPFDNNILFLTIDDKCYGLGANSFGVLGLGDTSVVTEPKYIEKLSHIQIREFNEGYDFVFARTLDNKVIGWGSNERGQLAHNYLVECLQPKMVESDEEFAMVSCGADHALALTLNGKLFGWGDNRFKQINGSNDTYFTKPVKISDNFGIKNKIRYISAGAHHSFAITVDDHVYSWGRNDHGILGQGNISVFNLPKIIDLKDIRKVRSNRLNSYFLTNDGSIYVCGTIPENKVITKPEYIKPKYGRNIHDIYCNKFNDKPFELIVQSDRVWQTYNNRWFVTRFGNFIEYFIGKQITFKTIKLEDDGNVSTNSLTLKRKKKYFLISRPFKSYFSFNKNKENQSKPSPKRQRILETNAISVYSLENKFNNYFRTTKYLGGGTYGQVYEVRHIETQEIYAVKRMIIKDGLRSKGFQEFQTMCGLNDKNVIRYESAWIEKHNHIYIQMECCQHNLAHIIKAKHRAFGRDEHDKMCLVEFYLTSEMFKEITTGVHYLHSCDPPIIHRDLKPQNILISNNSIKIGDFGLSVFHENDTQSHSAGVGTPRYMAPEVCRSRNYTTKADVYSLGVISIDMFNIDFDAHRLEIYLRNKIKISDKKFKIIEKNLVSLIAPARYEDRPSCAKMLQSMKEWMITPNEFLLKQQRYNVYEKLKNFEIKFFGTYIEKKFCE